MATDRNDWSPTTPRASGPRRPPEPLGSVPLVGATLRPVFAVRSPPSALTSLLLTLLGAVGCTNLLGLEGLAYEASPPEDQPDKKDGDVATTGGGGGDSSFGDLVSPPNTFPETWATGLFVTGASDALGTYYVYDRMSGALVVRQGASTTLPLREEANEPGWDLIHVFSDGEASQFVGYDTESGLTTRGPAPSATATLSAEPTAGTPGWTSLTTLVVDGIPHAFVYSATTGNARVGQWSPDGEGLDTTTLSWSGGFIDIAGAEIGGSGGIVRFDPASETLEFVPVTSEGVGVPFELAPLPESTSRVVVVPRGYVTTEVDQAVAITSTAPDANSRLIAYDGDDGTFSLLHVEDDGTLHEIDSEIYRAGLDAIVPLRGANGPFALLYSARTGVADALSLQPLASAPPVVIR